MTIRLPQDPQKFCQEPPVLHNSIWKARGHPPFLTYLEAFLGGDKKTKVVSYDYRLHQDPQKLCQEPPVLNKSSF